MNAMARAAYFCLFLAALAATGSRKCCAQEESTAVPSPAPMKFEGREAEDLLTTTDPTVPLDPEFQHFAQDMVANFGAKIDSIEIQPDFSPKTLTRDEFLEKVEKE